MICRQCQEDLPTEKFSKWRRVCKRCRHKNQWPRHYAKNKDQILEKGKKRTKANKLQVIDYYSNGTMKCNRCNMNDIRVLTLDHINGGGNAHRKQVGNSTYFRLIQQYKKTNQWEDGYQVLCMNCQFIKRCENNELRKRKTD